MVAIGIGIATVRIAVIVLLEPHHLGLGAMAHAQARIFFELVMNTPEIAAAIGSEIGARILLLLAVAEQRAEHARHTLVPRQLHEGLGLGHADQLGRLWPI